MTNKPDRTEKIINQFNNFRTHTNDDQAAAILTLTKKMDEILIILSVLIRKEVGKTP